MAEENPAGQDAVLGDKFGKYYKTSRWDFILDVGCAYVANIIMFIIFVKDNSFAEKSSMSLVIIAMLLIHIHMINGYINANPNKMIFILIVILYVWGVGVFLIGPWIYSNSFINIDFMKIFRLFYYIFIVTGGMAYTWRCTKNLGRVLIIYLATCWIGMYLFLSYGVFILLLSILPFVFLVRAKNSIPGRTEWINDELVMDKVYNRVTHDLKCVSALFVFPTMLAIATNTEPLKDLNNKELFQSMFYTVISFTISAELVFRTMIDARLIRIKKYY